MTAIVPTRDRDPDAELVRRLKAGGPEAGACFDRLVARHGPRLRRRAARILGDETDAEDVVQEVFTNVHRFLDRFAPDRPFSHWLSVVTLNACRIELRRRAARSRRHDAFEADPLQQGTTSISGDPILREALAAAFAALDARTRDCIVLRVLEGLSYQEIGQRCGQSEAAVKMRVLRGLRELRARHPLLAADSADASARRTAGPPTPRASLAPTA
jgi:RNA polymerase sigma-70 factor (ECF subfamily)